MKRIIAIADRFFPDDALLKSFVKGSIWSVFGNVVVKGFSFLASIVIARQLGSFTFGELSILKTTLSIFSLFATFGLGITVTKFIAESHKSKQEEIREIIRAASTITIILGTVLGLLLAAFAPFISQRILHSSNLVVPLQISGAYLFFNALNVYQLGVIAGLGAFKQLAKINLIIGIITLPVLITTTYFLGLNGTLIGLTLNLIVNWYLNNLLIRSITSRMQASSNGKTLREKIKLLLKFSYPLALKEIIYSLANWTLFYLLLIKTDYAEVGVYNSANQLCQLILFLPGSMLNVFLSLLSSQVNDKRAYSQLVKKNILFTILITAGIGAVVIIFSPIIYQFYGATYTGGEKMLYILTVATIPMSLATLFEQIWISHSKPLLITYFQFIVQFLILFSAILLFQIEKTGNSLALSFLIGYTIAVSLMYFYTKRQGYNSAQG